MNWVIKLKKLKISYKNIILYILTFIVVVFGDQLTKIIVEHTLQLNAGYTIIDSFFIMYT